MTRLTFLLALFLSISIQINGQTEVLKNIPDNTTDEKIIGTWEGIDNTNDVGYIVFDSIKFAYFIMDGDTIGGKSFVENGVEGRMEYKIDKSQSPWHITFEIYTNADNELLGSLPGIYEYTEKSQLKLCLNFLDNERPTEFIEGDDDTILLKKIE